MFTCEEFGRRRQAREVGHSIMCDWDPGWPGHRDAGPSLACAGDPGNEPVRRNGLAIVLVRR
jgi:hypothetical protein